MLEVGISGTVPLIQQIEQSHDKPFMTDGLPQLLLYLAGISSKWNQEDKNLLSPNYHWVSMYLSLRHTCPCVTLVLSLPCLNREGSAYYFLAIHDVNAARKPI